MNVVAMLDAASLDFLACFSGFSLRFKNGNLERMREVSLFLRREGWKVYPAFVFACVFFSEENVKISTQKSSPPFWSITNDIFFKRFGILD